MLVYSARDSATKIKNFYSYHKFACDNDSHLFKMVTWCRVHWRWALRSRWVIFYTYMICEEGTRMTFVLPPSTSNFEVGTFSFVLQSILVGGEKTAENDISSNRVELKHVWFTWIRSQKLPEGCFVLETQALLPREGRWHNWKWYRLNSAQLKRINRVDLIRS